MVTRPIPKRPTRRMYDAMAVDAYRAFARHTDCTEDEAEFLVIVSDIVEGKAP